MGACAAPELADAAPPQLARDAVLESSPRHSRIEATPRLGIAELLKSHYGVVWRTLRRVGVAPDRIDDAAQEVFIVASRKLDQIKPGSERNYLLGSAVRIAANYRRSSRARCEVLDDGVMAEQSDPEPPADQLLYRKRLRETLDEIFSHWPSELRTAFVLFELEGLSVPEIAEITDAKTGTVASRLRRARELFESAAKRLKARGVIEGER
jgi:RNA polymerase sigma-70 factor (ECF subfamily)